MYLVSECIDISAPQSNGLCTDHITKLNHPTNKLLKKRNYHRTHYHINSRKKTTEIAMSIDSRTHDIHFSAHGHIHTN